MDKEKFNTLLNKLKVADTKNAIKLIDTFAKANGSITIQLYHFLLCGWNRTFQAVSLKEYTK